MKLWNWHCSKLSNEDGHSAGFSEVYGCLCDLAQLAEKLINNKI